MDGNIKTFFPGKFQWSESHAVAQYTNWMPDQPNNGYGEAGGVF